MAESKPRILNNSRDMLWSLVPLVIACLVIAGVAGTCSFRPNGPSQGQIPSFDVNAALTGDAQTLDFPIRVPKTPDGWTPNSGDRQQVTAATGTSGTFTWVGYVTKGGTYLKLGQSDATEDALVPFVAGSQRSARGTESAGGHDWVVYSQDKSEPIWVADLGSSRVLMTGTASDAEFQTMAIAVLGEQPVARK